MVIFLYGPDTYRSRQKLKELKEKFTREVDPSGSSIVMLDGTEMKAEDFRNAVSASSMFVRKRMVVVERLVEKGKKDVQEEVAKYLQSGEVPTDAIVVFWEENKESKNQRIKKSKNQKIKKTPSKKSTALLPVLLKQEFVQEFTELTPLETEKWIVKEVATRGGILEPNAARFLAAAVGNDCWRLENEIGKLLGNKKTIGIADVREHVISRAESAIFDFTDALSARNSRGALACLERELRAGSAPLYLLTMIVRQFRILLQLKLAEAEDVSQYSVAEELKLNPYVVRKTLPYLASFSLDELKGIHARLVEMDLKMKTSSVDPEALLTLFVTNVTLER